MIREAEARDRDQLYRLYKSLVPNSKRMQVLEKQIETIRHDPNNLLLVYEEKGIIIGTLTLNICLQALHGMRPYGIIENIVVDEMHRSRGVGSELLQYVEEYCRSLNCRKIMLLSHSSRIEAHRFFEREGFNGTISRGFKKYLN
ncbi:GNAT family N-acetyltransferase [Marinicrinis lubricantis]|uniref:GNAT family N-acetyltransferase n=1 Tax=Marinicrinis lubricantis TaxID=2086470 RepID=A0ABW1IPE0_9BACL